jgi:hypothetical protein
LILLLLVLPQVLKKFEERTPGLFPAGIDFAALGKKVVDESIPKPKSNNKGNVASNKDGSSSAAENTDDQRAIASLDDFSPELQAMVGFSPNEIAAAREYIVRSASSAPAPYAPLPPPPPPAPAQYAPPPAIPAYVAPVAPAYAPPPPPPAYPAKAYFPQPIVNFPDARSKNASDAGSAERQQCGNRTYHCCLSLLISLSLLESIMWMYLWPTSNIHSGSADKYGCRVLKN